MQTLDLQGAYANYAHCSVLNETGPNVSSKQEEGFIARYNPGRVIAAHGFFSSLSVQQINPLKVVF